MRLPFLKLWQNAFERAHVLAPLIQADLAAAIGYQALTWKWGLEMSPEDEVTGVFEDDDIPGLLKAITGYPGDAKRLLSGFTRVHLIELRPPTGFFMVGLPQYDREARDRENDARRKREARARTRAALLGQNADHLENAAAAARRSPDDHRTLPDVSADIPRTSGGRPEDDPPSGGRPAPVRRTSGGHPPDAAAQNGVKSTVPGTSGGRPADVQRTSGGVPQESGPQTQTQSEVVTGLRVVRGREEQEDPKFVSPPPPPAAHAPTANCHPDLEDPPPPCSVDAFLAAWFELRAQILGTRGRSPGSADLKALAAVVGRFSEWQWRVAIEAYLTCKDPNARFTGTYPLRAFLKPAVHEERIPEPLPLRILCAVPGCGRVHDTRSPTGRGLCFHHAQAWDADLHVALPVPGWRRIPDYARPNYTPEELEQNEREGEVVTAAMEEREARRAEHFARWLSEQKLLKLAAAAP